MSKQVSINIETPKNFAGKTLTGERIPIGKKQYYKPCIAKMPDGELLLINFMMADKPPEGTKKLWGRRGEGWLDCPMNKEEIFLFRSRDGGKTWSEPENLTTDKGLLGREPYFSILKDGTILVTVHFVAHDIRNTGNYTTSYVHRSADGGKNWTTVCTDPEGMTAKDQACTTRNILELSDGSLLLGTSKPGRNEVWRSYDKGLTWSEKYESVIAIAGLDRKYPFEFFGEGVWRQAPSGKIYLIQRIEARSAGEFSKELPEGIQDFNDQYDLMVLFETTDQGRTLKPIRSFGSVGEMYPAVLKLNDSRLLLTFTVRKTQKPLGVRAILGTEFDDDFEFDLSADRFMLDTQTAPDVSSGGGFGRTVQLDDDTLITSYSWRDAKEAVHSEVIRWNLPE